MMTFDRIEMTKTIEQLAARVRELEEENARLKAECDDIKQVQFPRKLEAVAVGWKKQLAASQAYAEQLREVIEEFVEFCTPQFCACEPDVGYKCRACNPIEAVKAARELLAVPRDTSVLDAYVAKRLHDMACDKGLLRIQVEELTRQRDLAVEAMEAVKGCFDAAEFEGLSDRIHEASVEYGSLADLVMRRLSPALSTIEHALSAIKSEAMAQGEKP